MQDEHENTSPTCSSPPSLAPITQLDRQEAELRAEQRRIQIERANKILFDETDRVKGFHSKMLLCDVLHENTQLQEVKRQIEVLKRAQEQAYVEQQRQALEVRHRMNIMLCAAGPHRAACNWITKAGDGWRRGNSLVVRPSRTQYGSQGVITKWPYSMRV